MNSSGRILAGLVWMMVAVFGAVQGAGAAAAPKPWLEVELGIVGIASEGILESAIEQVRSEEYGGLLIVLDTPGGALEATRGMVKAMMGAPFPVVVWVGPGGARAGSAGAFITIAAHIAAMAPGTNIGAAHPVQASGKDIEKGDIAKKVENDTAAFMESIARTRGRNPEMAVSFVVNSLSVTASEALENKIIDLMATDKTGLMNQIHGRTVKLSDGRSLTVETKEAALIPYEKSLQERFLEILSNPNLFYLLFIAGILGIGFELTHPGAIVPGVVGAIALILALIATSVLPVSFGAMLLIVAALGFMIAEMFIPSFGILGIGGFVAFVIGSFLLVDPGNEQGLRISVWSILPGAVLIGGFGIWVAWAVVRLERSQVSSGAEAMVGQRGEAMEDFSAGRGRVRFTGENWRARSVDGSNPVAGEPVVIEKIKGLELLVRSTEDGAAQDT